MGLARDKDGLGLARDEDVLAVAQLDEISDVNGSARSCQAVKPSQYFSQPNR